jgi:lysyl-tRNA synthetase class 2
LPGSTPLPPDSPWWTPERHADRRPLLLARNRIEAAIRGYLAAEGFVMVDPPGLQRSPGNEAHLHAFATELIGEDGHRETRYLHTSPEFSMKKLLAAGETKIASLGHVWRNRERTTTHHPEFTMLEWYRAGASYRDLMEECEALLRAAADAVGAATFRWNGVASDPRAPWQVLTVQEAFARWCGIDLLATAPNPLAPDLARLAAAARPLGIAPREGDTWEDLFFRIFLERIEPELGRPTPTILTDYPVSMAALARPKPEDPRVAERFELYVAGLELANAFGELTDAAAQRARFEADQAKRRALYGNELPIDEDFLAALAHGMPESAGIALGFDRLAMLATGAASISQVIWSEVL